MAASGARCRGLIGELAKEQLTRFDALWGQDVAYYDARCPYPACPTQ